MLTFGILLLLMSTWSFIFPKYYIEMDDELNTIRNTPNYLLDCVFISSSISINNSSSIISFIIYPIYYLFYSLSYFYKSHRVFTTSIIHNIKPKNYKETCISNH